MLLSTRLCRSLVFAPLLVLLCVLPRTCAADYLVGDISRERARELGITVRAQPSANHDLRIEVQFKAVGQLKAFNWADLELRQGEKRLVTAALLPRKPAIDSPAESKLLDFYIDPAALPNASVTLYIRDEPLGGTGYRLQMKDFTGR